MEETIAGSIGMHAYGGLSALNYDGFFAELIGESLRQRW
jgi:hypothetical protein